MVTAIYCMHQVILRISFIMLAEAISVFLEHQKYPLKISPFVDTLSRYLSVCLFIYKDLMCTFRASCYSARLSWALVLTRVSPFVQDKKVGFGLGGELVIIRFVLGLPIAYNVPWVAQIFKLKYFLFINTIISFKCACCWGGRGGMMVCWGFFVWFFLNLNIPEFVVNLFTTIE